MSVTARIQATKMPPKARKATAWGRWVQGVRHKTRLNQTDFGAKIHRSKGTVTDWERGVNEPDRGSVQAIMAAFPSADLPPFLSSESRASDVSATVPGAVPTPGGQVPTDEGKTLAAELDAIEDQALRHKALRKAMKAIDDVLENPSRPAAEETAPRGRHS